MKTYKLSGKLYLKITESVHAENAQEAAQIFRQHIIKDYPDLKNFFFDMDIFKLEIEET